MPLHDGQLSRITIHIPDETIHTTRVRGVGFRIRCRHCGFVARGKKVRDARAEMRGHVCGEV